MAKIQIADLHSENVVELTAEEQYLIQGGFLWIPFLLKAAVAAGKAVKALAVGATIASGTATTGRIAGWW